MYISLSLYQYQAFFNYFDSIYSTGEECSGNIGATVDVGDSPIQSASERLLETLNNFKPALMRALKGNTYLSELYKMLDEKLKCRFYDIIALHPRTSVNYTVKETAACLVSQ